jgi:hypothetical protein
VLLHETEVVLHGVLLLFLLLLLLLLPLLSQISLSLSLSLSDGMEVVAGPDRGGI